MASDTDGAVRRNRRWPIFAGVVVLALAGLIVVFRWSWLIPIIEARAGAVLGRSVSLRDVHVSLGRVTHVVIDDLRIGNPVGWPSAGNFGSVEHLVIDFDVGRFFKTRELDFPRLSIERPDLDLQQLADGNANWRFGPAGSSESATSDEGSGAQPGVDHLNISDGTIHIRSVPLRADFNVGVGTRTGSDGHDQISADAKGTYAGQPITASLIGGALLSLRDQSVSYPVELDLKNGPTSASAKGTIDRPLAFRGVNARLEFAGPDMALLLPLTGIAIPKTPPYRVSGHLTYGDSSVTIDDFVGKVGSSDIGGKLAINVSKQRPDLSAALVSKSVNLDDLSGFIGAQPSGSTSPKPARASSRVLPDEPLSIPRLTAADVHLTYSAARIQGRRQPLDSMKVAMDIVDGSVNLHPLAFTIGRGEITSEVSLAQTGNELVAKADVSFQRVDAGKLLGATGVAQGAGTIGGRALIDGAGRSISDFLARGNGELKLYMGTGGNLSALLVDLSGLHFGNALLSALGLPDRTRIECLITDLVLTKGIAQSRLTLLDTDEARVGMTGQVDLRNEVLHLMLRTEAKHFSIGSLPTPIAVEGTFQTPNIKPDLTQLGERASAAGALALLLGPAAAILPTIQTGIGEDGACTGLIREARTPPTVRSSPPSKPNDRARRRGR